MRISLKRRNVSLVVMFLMLSFIVLGCSSGNTTNDTSSEQGSESNETTEETNSEASSEDKEFMISFSTYPVGSSGYTMSAALADTFQSEGVGIRLRNIPIETDKARIIGISEQSSDVALVPSPSTYNAFNGVFDYAYPEFGPLPVRQLWNSAAAGIGLVTAGDTGIKEVKDLKGKKVPYFVGSPSTNYSIAAMLSFAELTPDDVELVEFPSIPASWTGVIDGSVDVTVSNVTAGPFQELAASKKGVHWVTFDPEDKDGWARLRSKSPYYSPLTVTEGAGITEDNPAYTTGVAYPYFMVTKDKDEEMVYKLTKEIHENFNSYKDIHPQLELWDLEKGINVTYMLTPFHDGSIKYFKEIGWWSDELEAKQQELLEREKDLAELWQRESSKFSDYDDPLKFNEYWMEVISSELN